MIDAQKFLRRPFDDPPAEIRPMRWLPLLAIAAMTAYVLALLLVPDYDAPLVAGTGGAVWILPSLFWTIGPLKTRPAEDECEAGRRRDGYLFALFAIGGLNLMVEPLMMAVAFVEHWSAARVILAALGLLVYSFFLLPTLATAHISWAMPREE